MATNNDENNATGMLDVGKHCAYCKQLDFLTFKCRYCDNEFCAKHRSTEEHDCNSKPHEDVTPSEVTGKQGDKEFFKIFLPETSDIRIQQGNKAQVSQPKGKDILNKSKNNSNALSKLLDFFHNKKKTSNYKDKIFEFKSSNSVYALAAMKKTAKGDNSIPLDKRTYVKCYVIDENKNEEPTDAFINNTWSLGKTLDYLANILQVSNINNNFKVTEEEQLFLCKNKSPIGNNGKIKAENITCLNLSGRVHNEISNLDILYLVRGNKF